VEGVERKPVLAVVIHQALVKPEAKAQVTCIESDTISKGKKVEEALADEKRH